MGQLKLPLITVVMPVYNAAVYLKESIDSILNQSYTDFIFLIINDCSTDNTEQIILEYNDRRIKYIKNEKNIGVRYSLNKAVDLTQTKYLVRMDADDISLPNRLQWQIDFMEQHLSIGVCGGLYEIFGNQNHVPKIPMKDEEIKAKLIFINQICHPSIMIRMEVLRNNNVHYGVSFEFNDSFGPKISELEDFALWHRLKSLTKFENIDKLILRYRMEGQNISYNKESLVLERKKSFFKHVLNELDIHPSYNNLLYHISFKYFENSVNKSQIAEFRNHLDLILHQNSKKLIYSQHELIKVVDEKWEQFFYHLPPKGWGYVFSYFKTSKKMKGKHLIYFLKFSINKITRADKRS